MKQNIFALAAASAAALLFSFSAASAQESPVTEAPPAIKAENSVYRDLTMAIASDEMMERGFQNIIDIAMPNFFMQDEDMAQLEELCPGTIDAIIENIKPTLQSSNNRDDALYREDLTNLFAKNLSEQDAVAATDFYTSDLGKKLLMSVATATTIERSMAGAIKNEDSSIKADDLQKDTRESVLRGIFKLTGEERTEIFKILLTADWAKSYRPLVPRVQELQLKLANADFSEEEYKEIERVAEATIEKHAESCGLGE